MIKKKCPICETKKFSHLVYKKNLPKNNKETNFSGSKNPDGFHYEMLRCSKCYLLYASEIYEETFSNNLYENSKFNNTAEINGLKKTYSNCISRIIKDIKSKSNFLEIGCGSGYMLEVAMDHGFKKVEGVEPSKSAIKNARKKIKNNIHNKTFNVSDFKENSYDLIFIAMIIEHVLDINYFLKSLQKILKPGGFIICICHNESHFLSKLLKNKHPIINDQHVCDFGRKTLFKIFSKNLFKDINISNLKNYYTIKYWVKMLPFPNFIKNVLQLILTPLFKNRLIGINAGNLYLIARK